MRASRDILAREQNLYLFNNAVLRESVFYDQLVFPARLRRKSDKNCYTFYNFT